MSLKAFVTLKNLPPFVLGWIKNVFSIWNELVEVNSSHLRGKPTTVLELLLGTLFRS